VEGGVVVGRLGDLQPLEQQHQPETFEKIFIAKLFLFFFFSKPNKQKRECTHEKKRKKN
jgi:hypothetical protein